MAEKVNRKVVVNRYRCAYCGACVAVCNFSATELIETFLMIDEEKCTGCMMCVKACPMGALTVVEV